MLRRYPLAPVVVGECAAKMWATRGAKGSTAMSMADRDKPVRASDVTRRDFLRAGGAGVGVLGLGWHELEALGRSTSRSERSVILLLLVGGPSQLETWDPKPDAPAEVRGPFGSIQTTCPGVRISEYLPRTAARFDRLAIVRSVHHDAAPIHETGFQLLQTGRSGGSGDGEYPHFGSVVARLRNCQTPCRHSASSPARS